MGSDCCRKHVDSQGLLIFCGLHDSHEHADAEAFRRIVGRIYELCAFFCVERLAVVLDADEDVFTLMHDTHLYRMLLLVCVEAVFYYSETQLFHCKCRIICFLSVGGRVPCRIPGCPQLQQ